MSARPGPDEAEQLRELTRQAHEAAKDLRAAIREHRAALDAGRAELAGGVQEYLAGLVSRASDVLAIRDAEMLAKVEQVNAELGDWAARISGDLVALSDLVDTARANPAILAAGRPRMFGGPVPDDIAADLLRQKNSEQN